MLALGAGLVAVGFGRMRKQAGQPEAAKRTLLIVGMFALGAGLTKLKDVGLRTDLILSVLPLFIAFAEWKTFVGWPGRKRAAGQLLADLGPHPSRRAALLLGVSGLLTSAADLLAGGPVTVASVALQILFLSTAIFSFVVARSRISATKQGILLFEKLIKWDNIASYEWVRGGKHDFLFVTPRTRMLFGQRIKLELTGEQRERIQPWLEQHAPATPGRTAIT